MKKEFLKIAGVKSEREFYGKYPTQEAFFEAHPEAIKKLAQGIKHHAKGGEAYPQTATMDNFFSYGVPVPPTYYAHGGAFPMAQPENIFFSPGYGQVYNPYNKAMGGNTESYPQSIPYGNLGQSKSFYFMQEGGTNPEADALMKQIANALAQGEDPKKVVEFLIKKGVPQENAVKIVQGIMTQMSGSQEQAQQAPQQMQQAPMQQAPMQEEQMQQPQMDFGGSSKMDMGVKNKTGFFAGLVKSQASKVADKQIMDQTIENSKDLATMPFKRGGRTLLKANNGVTAPGKYSDPGSYASANQIDAVLANQYKYDPSYAGALGNFIDSAYRNYYELAPDYDISALKADPIYNQLYQAYGFTAPGTGNTSNNANQNQNQNQQINVTNPGIQAYVPGLYNPYNTNQFIVTSNNNMPVKYKAFDNAGNLIDSGKYNQPLVYGMYPELYGTSGIIDPSTVVNTPRARQLGLIKYEENLAPTKDDGRKGWWARNFMRDKRTYYFDTTGTNTPTNLPGSPNASNANAPATTTNIPPYLAAPANPNAPAPAWSPSNIYQPPKSNPFQGPNVTIPYLPGYTSPSASNAPAAPGSPGAMGPSTIPGINVPPYQTGPMGPILPNIPGVNMPGLNAPAPYMPPSIIPYAPGTNPPPSIPGVDPGPFSIDAIDNALQQQTQQQTQQGPLLLPGMTNYNPNQTSFNDIFQNDPASVAARNAASTPTVNDPGFEMSDVTNILADFKGDKWDKTSNISGHRVDMSVNDFIEQANLGNYDLEVGTIYNVGKKGETGEYVIKRADGTIMNVNTPMTAKKLVEKDIQYLMDQGFKTMTPPAEGSRYRSIDNQYITTTPPYMIQDPNFTSFQPVSGEYGDTLPLSGSPTYRNIDQRRRNFIDWKADQLIKADPTLTKEQAEILIMTNPGQYGLDISNEDANNLAKMTANVNPFYVSNPSIYPNIEPLPASSDYIPATYTESGIPFSGQEVPLSGGFQSGSLPSSSTNFRTGQTVDRYSGETTYMVYDPDDINSVIATGKTPEAAMEKAQKKFNKRRGKKKAYGGLVKAEGGLNFNRAYNLQRNNVPGSQNLTAAKQFYDVKINENLQSNVGKQLRNLWGDVKENPYYTAVGLTAGLGNLFTNSDALQGRLGANDPMQLKLQNDEAMYPNMSPTKGTYLLNSNDNFMGPFYNRSDISIGRMGGSMAVGGVVDMTPEEIDRFTSMGGEIEYV